MDWEKSVYLRNKISRIFYKIILKPAFFLIDPERVHNFITQTGKFLGERGISRKLTSFLFSYSNSSLEQNILGIEFKNPIGLAAGFDKNAELTEIIPEVGFGFEEIGSVTGEFCPGNLGTRLWRLKNSRGLVVNYGLKNDGAEAISNRLRGKKFKIPIGVSVAKTNSPRTVETETGIKDYVKAYQNFAVANVGDYFTINISCPNAFGGQPFSGKERLEKLLKAIGAVCVQKPIFIKVSPDLNQSEINDILELGTRYKINGFICSNLTKNRKDNEKILDEDIPEKGGMSGKIVEDLANDLIAYIYKKSNGRFVIIGCGGVFTAEDAWKKITRGASLIQLITGMIFEGPQVISEINQGLIELLRKNNLKNVSEAVGIYNKS